MSHISKIAQYYRRWTCVVDGHAGYRIVGVQMGKTAASTYYIYWVPEQYVQKLRQVLTGVAAGGNDLQSAEVCPLFKHKCSM
jgi:hypothetical protein